MRLSRLENNEIRTKEGTPSFVRRYDVICVGLGAAGCYAAIAAAREGTSVLAVERDANIGGMPVNGNVTGYYYGMDGGSFEDADREALTYSNIFDVRAHQSELRQIMLEKRLLESKADCLFESIATGVWLQNNRVSGLRIWDKSNGRYEDVASSVVIDATSDGHIIRQITDKTRLGRKLDGKTVPFTERAVYLKSNAELQYDNSDSGYCNAYNPEDFTRRILYSHAAKMRYAMSDTYPLVALAPVLGIREGITFEGEETLNYRDLFFENRPKRTLFYAYSDLDKHGNDTALDEELYQNWWCLSNLATVMLKIPVPMGVVVPKGFLGIVTAGRCLSADNYTLSAVRMNRDMFRMGECVGIAAALSVKEGCGFLETDYKSYLGTVGKYGCFTGSIKEDYSYCDGWELSSHREVSFNLSDEEIISALGSDCPGAAIWSCYRTGNKTELLCKALNDKTNTTLKRHAAIALGMCGNKTALPVLREMVINRDCHYLSDNRRSNQFPSVMAICLLGRIGEKEDIALLRDIVCNPAEYYKPLYHTLTPDYSFCQVKHINYVYYQFLTHATAAWIKLARRFDDEHKTLVRLLDERFTGSSREQILSDCISLPPDSSFHIELSDFMKMARAMAKEQTENIG